MNDTALRKLNSLTKYPSIPTFHTLGNKGVLMDKHLSLPDGKPLLFTEKVDGTNARIIVIPGLLKPTIFVGSRENLLWAYGDLTYNSDQFIVKVLRDKVEDMMNMYKYHPLSTDYIVTFYFEVFGCDIGGQAKNYTRSGNRDFRLFDISTISTKLAFDMLTTSNLEVISSWRDKGGQTFLDESELQYASDYYNIHLTPRLSCPGVSIPRKVSEILPFLHDLLPTTNVLLSETGIGKPEGIVARTEDRSFICKIRYEDYLRTERKIGK